MWGCGGIKDADEAGGIKIDMVILAGVAGGGGSKRWLPAGYRPYLAGGLSVPRNRLRVVRRARYAALLLDLGKYIPVLNQPRRSPDALPRARVCLEFFSVSRCAKKIMRPRIMCKPIGVASQGGITPLRLLYATHSIIRITSRT